MEEVNEEEDDDGYTKATALSRGKDCRARCEDDECPQHANTRKEPESTTTSTVDHDRSKNGGEEVEDLQNAVDQGLMERIGDANGVEDKGQVIRDDTASRPLGDHGNEKCHSKSLSVGTCLPELLHVSAPP